MVVSDSDCGAKIPKETGFRNNGDGLSNSRMQ